MDERAAWLRLIKSPAIAAAAKRKLLAHFGSPVRLWTASREEIAEIAPKHAAAIAAAASVTVDADLAWLEAAGHDLITIADRRYPAALAATAAPPLALFTIGNAALLAAPQVAIVGSRNPTPAGTATATAIAAALAAAGITVTSGLAMGIDAAAHRGAIAATATGTAAATTATVGTASAGTVAVIGCGPDRIYPRANADLHRAIVDGGGVIVSEFATGTPPIGANFPRRNAVIAGLALGVLVVEAAARSGSLITARLAGEMGREVFAVPGAIASPLSTGVHRLLREGAKLVETVDDVLEELSIDTVAAAAVAKAVATAAVDTATADTVNITATDAMTAAATTPTEKTVLDAIGFAPAATDEIIGRTGLSAQVVSALLMQMELRGVVASCPGGAYVRVAAGADA